MFGQGNDYGRNGDSRKRLTFIINLKSSSNATGQCTDEFSGEL